MQLTDKQKKKIEKLAKLIQEGDLAVVEYLFEIEEKIEAEREEMKKEFKDKVTEITASLPDLAKILEKVKGDPGYTPVKGKDYFDGEPGKPFVLTDEAAKKIAKEVYVPSKVIETVIREQPIHTEIVREVAVFDEKKLEQELPKHGELYRDALELLKDDERLPISAINKLREELDELKKLTLKKTPGTFYGGGGGRGHIKPYDLTPHLDGVTKTFNLPAIWTVISVHTAGSAPTTFRPITDYTFTPTSITFTSEINASTTLAAGQTVIIVYEEA